MAKDEMISLIDVCGDIEKLKFELWVVSMEQSIANGEFSSYDEGCIGKSQAI